MLRKVAAFLKKDFQMESSYRLAFIFNFFGIFVSVLSYYFINKMFAGRMTPHLQPFGVDYFSYALLSTAFFGYVGVGLGSFSERIRAEQMQGTLESVLLTPTRLSTMLVALTMWNLTLATIDLVAYISLGVFFFKISFSNINALSTILIFVLTITSFSGLGILSACFIMIFKRGNPLGWIISSVEGLIGGVYFPITVLPGWMQLVAGFFPISYAVRAIELAVYRGYDVSQLYREISFLLLFSIVLLPAGLVAFKYSIKKSRRDGTLAQY